jgi:CO dehydrogenase maturation factor
VKLAIAGKGGAGKTSITGTLARVFARSGKQVLAVDNDMNPNLSLTVGIPAARMTEIPVFGPDVVRKREDGGYDLDMTLEEICDAYALTAPDGITLLTANQPTRAGTG